MINYGRPRLHGNGFIQMNLNADGSQRLHVWPDVPIQAQTVDTPIHDHIFNMRSTIITGEIGNVTYEYQADENGSWKVYKAEYVGSHNSILLPTGERGNIHIDHFERIKAGATYEMQAFDFHESVNMGCLAASIFDKTEIFPADPRVLCHVGIEPDNAFNRFSIDEAVLWPVITRAIQQALEQDVLNTIIQSGRVEPHVGRWLRDGASAPLSASHNI